MRMRWVLYSLLSCAIWLVATPPARAAEPSRFSRADVGSETLVLHRPAADGSATEGFVVDTQQLLRTLEERVLEAQGLGDVVHLELEPKTSTPPSSRDGYAYRHTFAAPFDSVTAALTLAPLEEPDEGALLFYLALVLAACVSLGLFALYRMVATQLLFAVKQSDFVSAVSHELKTPLTAIRMYGEMLQEDLVEDDARRHEYYRTITHESERLTRLIHNVLELSSLERGQRPLNSVVGDVQDWVRDSLDVLRPRAEREGISLELEITGTLPEVRYEPDALRQVVSNLVDNALKYSRDAEEKRVVIRCAASETGLRLSVRDFGPGVAPDQLEAIFEPFHRVERELTRTHEGTGIGLGLVRELVTAMGGTVTAHSVNPGLEVRVELPGVRG